MSESKSVFELSPRVRLEEDQNADGGVLFDSHTAAISTCNGTALEVLKALKKGADIDSMCKRVSGIYEVSPQEARADIVALLKDLTALEFICERK